jgi:hypothetical protein
MFLCLTRRTEKQTMRAAQRTSREQRRNQEKHMARAKQKPAPQDLPGVDGPGVGRVVIKEIEKVAKKFIVVDEELKDAKERHESLKLELAEIMRQHEAELGRDAEGALRYYTDEMCVSIEPGKLKLKVTSNGDVEDPDAENN